MPPSHQGLTCTRAQQVQFQPSQQMKRNAEEKAQLSSGSGGGDGSFSQTQRLFHTHMRTGFIHRLTSQHWPLPLSCTQPRTHHSNTHTHLKTPLAPPQPWTKPKNSPDLRLSLFPSKLKKKKKIKCHIKKLIHPLIPGFLEFHADHLKARAEFRSSEDICDHQSQARSWCWTHSVPCHIYCSPGTTPTSGTHWVKAEGWAQATAE